MKLALEGSPVVGPGRLVRAAGGRRRGGLLLLLPRRPGGRAGQAAAAAADAPDRGGQGPGAGAAAARVPRRGGRSRESPHRAQGRPARAEGRRRTPAPHPDAGHAVEPRPSAGSSPRPCRPSSCTPSGRSSLQLEGGYHDLGAFFDKVSRLPRIINITGIDIKAQAGRATPWSRLDRRADCTVTTFVLSDPSAAPAASVDLLRVQARPAPDRRRGPLRTPPMCAVSSPFSPSSVAGLAAPRRGPGDARHGPVPAAAQPPPRQRAARLRPSRPS